MIVPAIGVEDDERVIVRAQNRLLSLYRQLGRPGGWRAVAEFCARRVNMKTMNVSYVYLLVAKGRVPSNITIRRALFLPAVLSSERKARSARELVRVGEPGWEGVYMRKQLRKGRPSK